MGKNAILRYLGLGQKKELTCRISHFSDSLVIEYPIPVRIGSLLSPFGWIAVFFIMLSILIPMLIFHGPAEVAFMAIIAVLLVPLALTYWHGFIIKFALSDRKARLEFVTLFYTHSWVYDMAHVARLRAGRPSAHAGFFWLISDSRYMQNYELLDWSFKTLFFDYGATTVDVRMELTEKDTSLVLSAVWERFPHILAAEAVPAAVTGGEVE